MNLLAAIQSIGSPIGMMIGFVVFCVCTAIVIILVRWLLQLTGVVIPQPLMLVLGLIVFLIFLLFFLNWSGAWVWAGHR